MVNIITNSRKLNFCCQSQLCLPEISSLHSGSIWCREVGLKSKTFLPAKPRLRFSEFCHNGSCLDPVSLLYVSLFTNLTWYIISIQCLGSSWQWSNGGKWTHSCSQQARCTFLGSNHSWNNTPLSIHWSYIHKVIMTLQATLHTTK